MLGAPRASSKPKEYCFTTVKKQVFEDRPFRSRGAKVDSVGRDGTKMEAKSNPTTINKRTSNIYQQMETKTHKWSQQGVRMTRASFVTTCLDSEPKNGQGNPLRRNLVEFGPGILRRSPSTLPQRS